MALIICAECGKSVSDRAKECNDCGYPVSEFVKESSSQVRIAFPLFNLTKVDRLVSPACVVYNESGEEMARIKEGKYFTFPCTEPMTISIKRTLTRGNPTQLVHPGENYEIKVSLLQKLSIVKVDHLIQ